MRSSIFLSVFSLLSVASCGVLKRADASSFKLYAYGTGIGGKELFYLNSTAHLGDSSNVPSGNASTRPVPVTFSNNNNKLTAAPSNSTTQFTNATFYAPGPNDSNTQVGLSPNSTSPPSNSVSTGWTFYGHWVVLETSSGAWDSLFYAKTTDYDNVWSLHWNTTDDSTAIPLALRLTAPSN